jgi:predicted RNase H-like nuclease (RuvC/YqgF family)
MDSAFKQLTSTTPRMNWQLDQCYREGCKLERELAEAREQRDRLAEELKEAQNAIEMMLRDSSCRRIPAYTKEQLTAMEGDSDDH